MEFKTTKTHYIKGKISYDRVTSVLDFFAPPKLVKWMVKDVVSAKARSKSSKQIGTRVHNLINKRIETGYAKVTENDCQSVVNCYKAFEQWLNAEQPKIINSEKTFFDEKLMIAGTADLITSDTLIDYKTSEVIRPNYWLQLAMYRYMCPLPLLYIGVLRLDKFSGDYQYKRIKFDDRLVNVYLGLLNYYRFVNHNEESKKEEANDNGITYTEIESKLGIFKAEVRDDWSKWHREI